MPSSFAGRWIWGGLSWCWCWCWLRCWLWLGLNSSWSGSFWTCSAGAVSLALMRIVSSPTLPIWSHCWMDRLAHSAGSEDAGAACPSSKDAHLRSIRPLLCRAGHIALLSPSPIARVLTIPALICSGKSLTDDPAHVSSLVIAVVVVVAAAHFLDHFALLTSPPAARVLTFPASTCSGKSSTDDPAHVVSPMIAVVAVKYMHFFSRTCGWSFPSSSPFLLAPMP
jgi:hypothetical protein